ncbi:MAG: DUF2712 domain-containing protein [Bacilli bacterium]
MKNRSIRTLLSCAIVSIIISSFSIPAFAYVNDNLGYNFTIKPYCENSYLEPARFRETYDNNNSWKVQLSYSGEGNGTVTTFWLEKANTGTKSPASRYYDIQQGHAPYYKPAWDNADYTYVKLAAENNNSIALQYTASGIWDEETGVAPR